MVSLQILLYHIDAVGGKGEGGMGWGVKGVTCRMLASISGRQSLPPPPPLIIPSNSMVMTLCMWNSCRTCRRGTSTRVRCVCEHCSSRSAGSSARLKLLRQLRLSEKPKKLKQPGKPSWYACCVPHTSRENGSIVSLLCALTGVFAHIYHKSTSGLSAMRADIRLFWWQIATLQIQC